LHSLKRFLLTPEQTIRSAVECSGIGLHSGAPVSMRILPAASGTGIVFRRTDLDGFEIEAISRNVARVSYATSLMKKGVLISTTEHVLSAFIGMGIDNAIVELDNLELPILDGSARPFVEMIQKVGIRKHRRPRKYLKIRREVEMREGNKFIAVYPSDTYSVSYSINFPLRFPDEFVRHKVLDLVGDLALLGKQILGNVVADRAGHAMHTALVSRILRDKTLWEEVTFPSDDRANAVVPSAEAAAGSSL